MTFKEKWMQDHPDQKFNTRRSCPASHGYEPDVSCPNPPKTVEDEYLRCGECWNREMPTRNHMTPRILDSGARRQFETGAVRDDVEGKGRCDLMPLDIVGSVINGVEGAVIGHIAMFKETNATAELYLALAKFAHLTYSDSRPTMLLEVAKHFEEGAKKYGENNWQKGLPVRCYIDSAVRHYLKWLRGDKDEPHDRAFVWNLLCCIWEVDFSPRAKKERAPVSEEATVSKANPSVFYICNRKPCATCRPDCHSTIHRGDAAVLELYGNSVRYEDCPIGLFMHEVDGVFLKTEIINAETGQNTAVHIGLGLSRKFEPDAMVFPIKHPFEVRDRV